MKPLKSALDTSVTVLVIIAASLVIWRQFAPAGQSKGRNPVENASGTVAAEMATHIRGTGPVALIEFADFQCPFCGRHARDVEPMLRQTFVDTGVVRQIFMNYPLPNHPRAQSAGEAALCAGNQGKFWEMHDALFQNQTALDEGGLVERAREIALDIATFADCMKDGKERALIERHKSVARELRVQATPAFFLGVVQSNGSVVLKRRINGALPFSDFRSAVMEVVPLELRGRVGSAVLRRPGGAKERNSSYRESSLQGVAFFRRMTAGERTS